MQEDHSQPTEHTDETPSYGVEDMDQSHSGETDLIELELSGPFDHDKFLVNQKRLAFSEKYYVFDAEQNPVLFVHREAHHLRRLLALVSAAVLFIVLAAALIGLCAVILGSLSDPKGPACVVVSLIVAFAGCITAATLLYPKRHITCYADDSMNVELLKIYQDRKWQIPTATYTVSDADMNLIGWCRKNHLHDILRKKWQVYDASGTHVCTAKEDSIIKAIFRRFGPLGEFLRTNFILMAADGASQLGAFNRRLTLFDKYVLDMTLDTAGALDRRLAVAMAVLLDTAERR